MMNTLVRAPELLAPLHNLVASGNRVDTGDNEWENGVTFTQRGCYEVTGSCATCDTAQTNPDPQDCTAPASFDPYLLDLGVVFGAADRFDIKDLVTSDMEVGTSSRLERLIWAGCDGDTNPLLSSGTSLGAAASPRAALGAIVSELISAENHIGARGTVHMSPRMAMELGEQLATDGDGNLVVKFGGHKVILGNYPSTHIAGHVGDIDVYLGEIYLTEAPDEIRRANLQTFRVQRLALAAWNTCAAFVQEVTFGNNIDGGTP